MNKLRFFLFMVALLMLSDAFCQQDEGISSCAQNLLDAQALFAAGKLNQVPAKIDSCLNEGFTKDEKVTAYKLLSVTYTYLEEYSKADDAVLNLLKLEKEYRVNPEIDPTEFIKLYQKFRTYPIFQFGLKVGVNNPWMIFGNTYETYPGRSSNAGIYTMGNGLNAGLEFEIPLRKLSPNFELCPSLNYSSRSYSILATMDQGKEFNSIGEFQGTEYQTWFEIPVMARYIFHYKNLKPFFAELGPSINYLSSAVVKKTVSSSPGSPPKVGQPDVSDQRTKLNYAVQLGAGFKFDIPMAEIVIKTNFSYALNQLSIRNTIPSQGENDLSQANFNDTDFRMHYFSLTIGYIWKIYKPKKIIE